MSEEIVKFSEEYLLDLLDLARKILTKEKKKKLLKYWNNINTLRDKYGNRKY